MTLPFTRAAQVLRPIFVITVLCALAWQLWTMRVELGSALSQVSPQRMWWAGAAVVAGLLPGLLGWRRLLAGLGAPLPLATAGRLYFLSSLGKYLPGGVWPIVAQAGFGLSPGLAAAGFLATVLLSALAGCLVGVVALPDLVSRHPMWWGVLLAAVAGAIALTPSVRRRIGSAAKWLIRRIGRHPGLPAVPSGSAVAQALAWLALGWAVTGLHIAVLANAFAPVPLASAVGGFAIAAVAGMVFIVTPGGLGARELVLSLALVPALSVPESLAVVSISRLLITFGDLAAAAVAVAVHRQVAVTCEREAA